MSHSNTTRQEIEMHPTTKWMMGILGTLIGLSISAFGINTSKTLDLLVTDVAVIKAVSQASATENLPARVVALEGQVRRLEREVATMQTNRWTRQDQQAYERLNDARHARDEKALGELKLLFQDATPSDVLRELRKLAEDMRNSGGKRDS